jgi:hypothetical protein
MKPLTPDEIQKFIQHVPEVLTLWEAARAAEAKYGQTKNDETKAAFLKATFDFAERVMFHVNTPGQKDQLHDTQRYMVAYQSYDKVLDVDPAYEDKNCEILRSLGITGEILNKCPASGRVQTIENVYLGWGKTLPPLK